MKVVFVLILALVVSGRASADTQDFVERYPSLGKFRFKEPAPNIYFGFGLAPLEIVNSKTAISFSFFQVHWFNRWVDWEVFNASFGMTFAGDSTSNIRKFAFRSVPKFRVNPMFSFGPVIGYEFISFPEVDVRLEKESQFTPIDSFSSRGLIYGGAVSENFKFRDRYVIKATQFAYKQTYSTSHSQEGWNYVFLDANQNQRSAPVSAGWVYGIEFSFLF